VVGDQKSEILNPKSQIPNPSPFPLPPSPFRIVPPGETAAFLAPLPIDALRLPADTVRLLGELGLIRIGQLEALPREAFLSRFGPELLKRLDQALGRLDERVPACPVRPTFAVEWAAEYPTARRETIQAALEHLVRRVAALLAQCGRGALRLECRLRCEVHDPQSPRRDILLPLGLFQPTAAAKHLLPLLQLQVERLQIASPVTWVSVVATLTAPLEPQRQMMLFDRQCSPHTPCADPSALSFPTLIERLSSRLGVKAVVAVRLRPDAQPELSWRYDPMIEMRRRRAQKPLPIELPPRPLRLLPRPAPVAVMALAPDGPPLKFHFANRQEAVVRSWGPERIETGWWRGQAVGRDYFRVETSAGQRFWLFRRLRDEKWFLHGMFE
jgi:protein ImuB